MIPINPATRRLVLRSMFIIVLLVLLYAGLREHPVPEFFHEEDKVNHILGFAALAMSARLAFPRGSRLWQMLAILAVGAGIELLQNLLPARTGSVWDLLADSIGIAFGLGLASVPALRRLTDS